MKSEFFKWSVNDSGMPQLFSYKSNGSILTINSRT